MSQDFTKEFRRKLADGKTTDEALAELRAAVAEIRSALSLMETEK